MEQTGFEFWSITVDELLARLEANVSGLTGDEAGKRLLRYGDNLLKPN